MQLARQSVPEGSKSFREIVRSNADVTWDFKLNLVACHHYCHLAHYLSLSLSSSLSNLSLCFCFCFCFCLSVSLYPLYLCLPLSLSVCKSLSVYLSVSL